MRKYILLITLISIYFISCDNSTDNPNGDNVIPNTYVPDIIHNAVTDIDGNVYDAVDINGQIWMNSNLKVTRYADGTALEDYHHLPSSPNNDDANIAEYGLLYDWYVASRGQSSNNFPSGIQGICPDGWHLPSTTEWDVMRDYLSHQNVFLCNDCPNCIAKSLASIKGWAYSSMECTVGNDVSTNNTTGFAAMPAGYLDYGGSGVCNFGMCANFWSSVRSDNGAYHYTLYYNSAEVEAYYNCQYLMDRLSVRCVKN